MRLALALLISLLPASGALAGPATARSGYVAARTRQVAGGKTTQTTAELWFTATRSRLSVRTGGGPATLQVFDGVSMYQWSQGARVGQKWHPVGLKVLPDMIRGLLSGGKVAGRKRQGSGKVAGLPCAVYHGKVTTRPPDAWWQGDLDVRVWESLDRRFPYVLRSVSADRYGNRLESEITGVKLNTPIKLALFRAPALDFHPPTQVLRGTQVAGGHKPLAGRVAVYLADALAKGKSGGRRQVVTVAGTRYALDRAPLTTQKDVQEARLEPFGPIYDPKGWRSGEALVLYLNSRPAARLAQAAAKAKGRYFVILVSGSAAGALAVETPRIQEDNRVPILGPPHDLLVKMAERLRGGPLPRQ